MTQYEKDNTDLIGEISGSYLLGLVASFKNLDVVDNVTFPFDINSLDADSWYPYSYLVGTINAIEPYVSDSLLFQAGIEFLRIWYELGPGKDMIFSTYDWLHANDEGQGYNSVARGGNNNQIGWCKTLSYDEKAGICIIENVMPLRGEYLRGLFYGGCQIFDDTVYVQVTSETGLYIENPDFHRTVITINFRLKSIQDFDTRITQLTMHEGMSLSSQEVDELIWMYKGLKNKYDIGVQYQNDSIELLASSFEKISKFSAELKDAKEVAEASNEIKSEFLAMLSHELKTSMSVLRMVLGAKQIDSQKRETAIRAINDMNYIIGRTKYVEQLDEGKIELDISETRIQETISNIIDNLGSESRFTITENAVPHLMTDSGLFSIVLTNLFHNAIKYANPTKPVTVAASTVKNHGNSAMIEISISNYPGKASWPDPDKVFSKYYRHPKAHYITGSGLGLYLSSGIARLLGGHIDYKPDDEQVRFVVLLPITPCL